MINGLQLGGFSNYIHHPKTWFHHIPVKYKVFMISTYLIIISYLPTSLLISIAIIILCMFILLAYRNNSAYLYRILFILIAYCILLLLITNVSSIATSYYMITIPYNIKFQYLKNNLKVIYIFQYRNIITVWLSSLVTRMVLLLTSYYLGYQLIMLTTQLEEVFIYNLYTFHDLSHNLFFTFIPDLIFIIILSYEYIFLIEHIIKNIITSITLRGQSFSTLTNYREIFHLCSLLLIIINSQLHNEIYMTNRIIYSRELYMSTKQKWLINLNQ